MFRTPSPHGRTTRRWMVVLAVVGVLIAVPAAALADPVVTIDNHYVSGREALNLTLSGVESTLRVEIVDQTEATAIWVIEDPGEVESLDLLAPVEGAPPVNGDLTVTVTADGVVLPTEEVVLDADPPAPTLTAEATGSSVNVDWPGLRANGPLTYRLERDDGDGTWDPLLTSSSATAFVDRGLEAGQYRYRVIASIPAADPEGSNQAQSEEPAVSVPAPVVTPEESPDPPATPSEPATPSPSPTVSPPARESGTPADEPERKASGGQSRDPRPVAATGRITKPVASQRTTTSPRSSSLTRGIALVPNVADRNDSWSSSVVPAPDIAAPRVAATERAWSEDFWSVRPISVPPAGTLAVEAGRTAAGSPAAMFIGLLTLVAATAFVSMVRARGPHQDRAEAMPAPDAPR
ncbi:MAG: hypothetical protein GEU74_16130 [Nitriliruptorales bacterium]|nr:hypothetical protein [Nitriliruptorales bacterium]